MIEPIPESETKKKRTRREKYNDTNTCDICGEEDLISESTYKEYDQSGVWTGRWMGKKCYTKIYYHTIEKNRPDSIGNMRKSLRNRRTGNLNKNSAQAKGDIFERLTCEWRGVDNLNIENDNFNSPIDHSRDIELGIIQTKGRVYNYIDRRWPFTCFERDHHKEFDHTICYCTDEHMKNIERVYIFPRKEVLKRTVITIYKDPSRDVWYDKYIIDEATINKINEIFQKVISERLIFV